MKKIKVYVSERVNHETNEKFKVFKALTKQGKIDLRFTKDVAEETKPTKVCNTFCQTPDCQVQAKVKVCNDMFARKKASFLLYFCV